MIDEAMLIRVAAVYGTPAYVFEASVPASRLAQLRAALPAGVGVHYSLKANPNRHLVRLFAAAGAGFEIGSTGELDVLLAERLDRRDTLFIGPAKRDEDLAAAVAHGVGLIVAESPGELARITAIRAARVPVALRLNPGRGDGDISTGGATPFGMDCDTAIDAVRRYAGSPFIDLRGVHAFLGSGVAAPEAFCRNVARLLETASAVTAATGWSPRFAGLGGGFTGRRYASDEEPDWRPLAGMLDPLLAAYRRSNPGMERFAVESGRFLIGPAGVLVLRVVDLKRTRSELFALADGGINVWGSDDRYFGMRAPLLSVIGGEGRSRATVTVCGPLCTPFDRLAHRVDLPELDVGDLLVMRNAGAYGVTGARPLLLSHRGAVELLHDDGALSLIRDRDGRIPSTPRDDNREVTS